MPYWRYLVIIPVAALLALCDWAGFEESGAFGFVGDAIHWAADVLAYGLGLVASLMLMRGRTAQAAQLEQATKSVNVTFFGVIALFMWARGIDRFLHPVPILPGAMLIFAGIGIALAVVVLWAASGLEEAHEHHETAHSQWLHALLDVASLAILIAAAVAIHLTGWVWLDGVSSLLIGAVAGLFIWLQLRGHHH